MTKLHFGLKLRTTDTALLPEARRCFEEGIFDYIELYVVPGTWETTGDRWGAVPIPMLIHAPHGGHGVNLADRQLRRSNLACYNEVSRFADRLATPVIIAHPGNNGTVGEAIEQLLAINDRRLCIENKPVKGLGGEICQGSTPEEIGEILSATGLTAFALDFGHAVYAARTKGVRPMELIQGFMKLQPVVFHISDGDSSSETDMHLNLGQGNLPIADFLDLLPRLARLTVETPRRPGTGLRDFIGDVAWLRSSSAQVRGRVSLRRATYEDRDLLLAWRNSPAARQASRQAHEIRREEHEQWLRTVLADPARQLYIALENDIPVGTVRADHAGNGYELSWNVAPGATGRGIGKEMVALLAARIRGAIRATIKADNEASIRIAESVGMEFGYRQDNFLHYVRPGD